MILPGREYAKTGLAGALICTAFFLTWAYRPTSAKEANFYTSPHFAFEHYSLSGIVESGTAVRSVHPSLLPLQSWISAVGAAVALNDIDGDGLPNDACLVDPRTDQVIVEPAPGTAKRYEPFPLQPDSPPDHSVAPMGCLPGDYDEDGRIDLLVYYWGRTPVIFLNHATTDGTTLGTASFTPVELIPNKNRWFSNAAVLADLDGDGHADLMIGNYFPDGAEILNAEDQHPQHLHSSMSHAYNGGNKHFLLWRRAPQGSVRYEEVIPEFVDSSGASIQAEQANHLLHGWTLAIGAADLNHDLLPEIYLANDFGPDRLFENLSMPQHIRLKLLEGRRSFFTPKSKVLGKDSFKGMGVEFVDINGDGYFDILVSNITDEFALEESNFAFVRNCPALVDSHGSACFTDQSEPLGLSRSGWSWDIKAADFDNSGIPAILQATGFLNAPPSLAGTNRWPQLHETAMGNDAFLQYPFAWHHYRNGDELSSRDRNRFFVQNGQGRYIDLSRQIGLHHEAPARGLAIADVDGDGRLDFAVANQWGASDFYRNTSVAGSSLSLRLLLPREPFAKFAVTSAGAFLTDTPAMTAEVTVQLPGGRKLIQQVNGGNGHSGKNSFELHFGLSSLPEHQQVSVSLRWRDVNGRVRSRQISLVPGQYSVRLGA